MAQPSPRILAAPRRSVAAPPNGVATTPTRLPSVTASSAGVRSRPTCGEVIREMANTAMA